MLDYRGIVSKTGLTNYQPQSCHFEGVSLYFIPANDTTMDIYALNQEFKRRIASICHSRDPTRKLTVTYSAMAYERDDRVVCQLSEGVIFDMINNMPMYC